MNFVGIVQTLTPSIKIAIGHGLLPVCRIKLSETSFFQLRKLCPTLL